MINLWCICSSPSPPPPLLLCFYSTHPFFTKTNPTQTYTDSSTPKQSIFSPSSMFSTSLLNPFTPKLHLYQMWSLLLPCIRCANFYHILEIMKVERRWATCVAFLKVIFVFRTKSLFLNVQIQRGPLFKCLKPQQKFIKIQSCHAPSTSLFKIFSSRNHF